MVAKINSGASLLGALSYNQQKVDEGKAHVLHTNNMIEPADGKFDIGVCMRTFEPYLLANRRTEKPVLHISINPDPKDRVSDEQLSAIAEQYMQKMGYGDQPYIVYKHEDIDRQHIHIVSLRVDAQGKKIDHNFEHRRSMDVCRELENKFGLKQITDKETEAVKTYLKKVDYHRGDVKRQVANLLKTVTDSYKFQSFGEFSAVLSLFNVEAKPVRGEFEGKPYNGVIYSATDERGNVLGTPFKSSLFGKTFGHDGLERRMQKTAQEFKEGRFTPKIKPALASAMKAGGSRAKFEEALKKQGIDVVFRSNEQGRIYGATFIDHNNKEVYNGSRLGKEFSANAFNVMFNDPAASRQQQPIPDNQPAHNNHPSPDNDTHSQADHSPSDDTSSVGELFGALDFTQHGRDFQEENYARKLRKKKKKKKKIQHSL